VDSAVRAFGGGELWGTKLVRVIYVDETGHAPKQPICAVAGIMLDPDKQWRALADRIDELKADVPKEIRAGFFFHATDLHYGGKNRNTWADDDRWALLDKLLALPRELRIPLAVGWCHRTKSPAPMVAKRMPVYSHALSYVLCLKAADDLIDNHAPQNEVAMVVAEERPEAHRMLRLAHNIVSSKDLIRQLLPDLPEHFAISRIKAPPAFAAKSEEVLLQMADACAFAFQRFLNGAARGDHLLQAILGKSIDNEVRQRFDAAGGFVSLWWNDPVVLSGSIADGTRLDPCRNLDLVVPIL
jgi:hypothetical protein